MKKKELLEIYTVAGHPGCENALSILNAQNIPYHRIEVGINMNLAVEMWARSECHTIPQIFVGNEHVGGLPELLDMLESGELHRRVVGE